MGRTATEPQVITGPWPGSGGAAPDSGASVFELSGPEQLLLWSARRWRHGRHGWSEVEAEFRRQLGLRWADALIAWEGALDLIHRRTAGLPQIENGCVTRVSRDERHLLSLVATAQRRDIVDPDLLIAGIAGRSERSELRRVVDELVEALGARRLPLGPPPAEVRPRSHPARRLQG